MDKKSLILLSCLFYVIGLTGQCYLLEDNRLYYQQDYDDEMAEDKFLLKTRIFILYRDINQGPWITGNDADELAQGMMDLLNESFNPHGIFFVNEQGACTPSHSPYFVPVPSNAAIEAEAPLTDDNYINISVHDPEMDPLFGWAYSAPNNYMKISGNEDGTLAALTPALIHEVGHLFGLIHTFESSCDESCNEPCTCTGDFVCDTAPHTNDNLPCAGPNSLSRNYMSYPDSWFCPDYFTPEQVQRMRAHLAMSEVLQPPQLDELIIDSPSGSIPSISGNIIITSGTDYVIDGTEIQMLPGASITVEENASLEIKNGAKLTGACGKMWEGIKVQGNYLSPQNTMYQGKVTVRGTSTVIEHAKCAISTAEAPFGGGIVEILGATLRNNEKGVIFRQYSAGPSISSILFANFTTDASYMGEQAPVYVDINVINGISIRYCDFLDERSSCNNVNDRAIGIDGFVTGSKVISCDFEDLNYGIRYNELIEQSNQLEVAANNFTRCRNGIYTLSSSNFVIYNNQFDVRRTSSCNEVEQVIGVHLKGETTGFDFRENSFFNTDIDGASTYLSIGTLCDDTHAGMDNNITKNNFEELHYGNWVTGNNGSADMGGMGLTFTCNTYEDLLTPDLTLENDNAIRIEDGATVANPLDDVNPLNNEQLPTGNEFTGLISQDILNGASNAEVDYYYYLLENNQKPNNASENIEALPLESPNSNCTEEPPCDFPCTENETFTITNIFQQSKTKWQQLNIIVDTITNKEERELVQDSIRRLRHVMDRGAAYLLQHYKSDTTQLQTDSVLAWLDRADSYPADYRLSKHYFFTNNWARFNALWPGLGQQYHLSGALLSEYDALTAIFDTLQPILSSGTELDELSKNTVDFLENQLGRCDEAAYLAQAILWRNGIWAESSCGGSSSGFAQTPQPTHEADISKPLSVKVYPNPANSDLNIELNQANGQSRFRLYNLNGQQQLEVRLSDGTKTSIQTGHLPAGLYFYECLVPAGGRVQGKVLIQH